MGRGTGIGTANTNDDDLPWYTIGSSEEQKMQYRKNQANLEAAENVRRAKQGLRPRTEAQDAYSRALNRAGSKPIAPTVKNPSDRQNVAPGGGSQRNVIEYPSMAGRAPSKMAPKRSVKPPVASKPAGEYVAPSSPESALTAGIQGLPGAQSGMAQEAGSEYGRTTYFGETPEQAAQVAEQMGEEPRGRVQFEDETAKPFWSRFKKGGQVKKAKKYAKGGTVSSASKRGDGICQRGKTKGRMV